MFSLSSGVFTPCHICESCSDPGIGERVAVDIKADKLSTSSTVGSPLFLDDMGVCTFGSEDLSCPCPEEEEGVDE